MYKTITIKIISFIKNFYKYWVKFLTTINHIKIYKTPCYVVYDIEEYDYLMRGPEIRNVIDNLKAGDIVLRKHNKYLDNMLIPGEFSHSGLYIGDNTIIHSTSEGVHKTDILDYLQCDSVMVLRGCIGVDKAVERANKWLGTSYDFKFNSSDSSEFYCHELVAMCFKDNIEINPVPAKFFGIHFKFLKPRYLAESFIDNEKFYKIVKYKNGKESE